MYLCTNKELEFKATDIRNAINYDHFVDWLNLYSQKLEEEKYLVAQPKYPKDTERTSYNPAIDFNLFLVRQNKQFKDLCWRWVYHYCKKFYGNKKFCATGLSNKETTTKCIQKGIPLIIQPLFVIQFPQDQLDCKLPVYIECRPDILLRKDAFEILKQYNIPFTNIPQEQVQDNLVYENKDYVAIQFAFVNVKVKQDFYLSSTSTLRYYSCLGTLYSIAGFTPYLYGRSLSCNKERQRHAFHVPGEIDHVGYMSLTKDAIQWLIDLRLHGNKWTVGCRPEMFPNVKVKSSGWDYTKKRLAQEIQDVSLMWRCGYKERLLLYDKGITSLNATFTSSDAGISEGYKVIFDRILHVNSLNYVGDGIETDLCDYPTLHVQTRFMYVDFESKNSNFDDFSKFAAIQDTTVIGVIGCLCENKQGGTEEKAFLVDDAHDEKSVLLEWLTWMKEKLQEYKDEKKEGKIEEVHLSTSETTIFPPPDTLHIWCYGHAEKSLFSSAFNSAANRLNLNMDEFPIVWHDLCAVLKKSNTAIRGARSFSIKDISKALIGLNKIPSELSYAESFVDSGLNAMLVYHRLKDLPEFQQELLLYNRLDVRGLYYIERLFNTIAFNRFSTSNVLKSPL